jgi:alpha-galactosidase
VPGLDPRLDYRAVELHPGGKWPGDGTTCNGAALEQIGLPAPGRAPESALVVHLVAV